ncbi:MAG: alkaline phosphatase family protein [Chloroflexia bacterium]|nr:alkaline phosphatase family protein [Chloroflexia bacterium]
MSRDNKNQEKVLIIGLDGATFDLIEPWAAQGKLPHLGQLMERGAWGRLRSTNPAHSAPAWTSCTTGVNPGQHGITSFFRWDPAGYRFIPVNAGDVRTPFFWDILGRHGLSTGLINLPTAYPPPPLNGYAISGMLAPSLETACYPADLHAELLQAAPDYQVEAPLSPNRQTTRDSLLRHMLVREEATHYLRQQHPTDCTMVVFTGLDRLQHFYWADMDAQHPNHPQVADQGLGQTIESGYTRLDQIVGRLLERTGEDTTVIVVSDHGFAPIYRRFMVNLWLQEQGLLRLRKERQALIEWLRRSIQRLGLRRLASRAKRMVPAARDIRLGSMSFAAVDWSQTQAVFGPNMGLLLNLQGREAEGVVPPQEVEALRARLTQDLKQIRDPETGQAIVLDVQAREDLYQGPAVHLAPDFRLQMADHREGNWSGQYIHQRALEPGPLIRPPGRVHAGHDPEGIFLAAGPGLRSGEHIENAHIMDIVPTVLYALGLPIPHYMDGRVLSEIFDPQHLARHPLAYSDEQWATDQAGFDYDDEETDVIEDRLRGLGYMS